MVTVRVRVMQLITRQEIIQRRQALIRAGLRLAYIGNSYRIQERNNVKTQSKIESITFRSPLISRVYHSVFCQGDSQ